MNISVLGAGALGCLYGAFLARAGNNVSLISRRSDHCSNITNNGLRVETSEAVDTIHTISAFKYLKEAPKPDLLIVLVKSYATESAMKEASPFIPDSCTVLTLQNGLGNIEAITQYIPPAQLLAGISYNGAALLGPGHISHAGQGKTIIGELDGTYSKRTEEIASVFTNSGLQTKITQNIQGLIWTKLMVNIALNPLAALTHLTNGELVKHEGSLDLIKLLLDEATAVAKQKNIKLETENTLELVQDVALSTASNHASMLQDIMNKKRTEINSMNGAIVEFGKKNGLETPVNKHITILIKLLEQSFTKKGLW